MMEEEFVRKRKWITQEEFLDRLAAANLIPGPSSTEVAIFIGQVSARMGGTDRGGCMFHHSGRRVGVVYCRGVCALRGVAADGGNSGGESQR